MSDTKCSNGAIPESVKEFIHFLTQQVKQTDSPETTVKPRHDDHIHSREFDELDALYIYLSHHKQQLEIVLSDLSDMRERRRQMDMNLAKEELS